MVPQQGGENYDEENNYKYGRVRREITTNT
jgi:hypothetical protein